MGSNKKSSNQMCSLWGVAHLNFSHWEISFNNDEQDQKGHHVVDNSILQSTG